MTQGKNDYENQKKTPIYPRTRKTVSGFARLLEQCQTLISLKFPVENKKFFKLEIELLSQKVKEELFIIKIIPYPHPRWREANSGYKRRNQCDEKKKKKAQWTIEENISGKFNASKM